MLAWDKTPGCITTKKRTHVCTLVPSGSFSTVEPLGRSVRNDMSEVNGSTRQFF